MKKTVRLVAILLLVVLLVIQFIRPERNLHSGPQDASLVNHFEVPDTIQNILKTSCFDCHSNNTKYPWYMNVQPVAWFLADHIKEGKSELNFDEFNNYTKRLKLSRLKSIAHSVEDDMPLWSYTLIHRDAMLTEAQTKLVSDWALRLRTQVEQQQ